MPERRTYVMKRRGYLRIEDQNTARTSGRTGPKDWKSDRNPECPFCLSLPLSAKLLFIFLTNQLSLLLSGWKMASYNPSALQPSSSHRKTCFFHHNSKFPKTLVWLTLDVHLWSSQLWPGSGAMLSKPVCLCSPLRGRWEDRRKGRERHCEAGRH